MGELVSDIVVIGAGHNALSTAAYLATAGLSVTVLEAREAIGGGTMTEELTGPGFRHDTFSSGHPGLLMNPIYTRDELGLFRNRLRYVSSDPVVVMPFPDGESITVYRDKYRTAREIARYSERDARAWLDLFDEWPKLAPYHHSLLANAPGSAPASHRPDIEERYASYQARSCWDVVMDRFESDHARSLMLWFGMVIVQPVDQAGTGLLPLSVPVGWTHFGWPNPVGGSNALAESLGQVVEQAGGKIITGSRVERIFVDNGRASGVRTSDGRIFSARRAVVSSMHFTALRNVLETPLPAALAEAAEDWRPGAGLFVIYLAVNESQRIRTRDGAVSSVLGARSTVEGVRRQLADLREGRLTTFEPYMLHACSTLMDPSRAPEGKATLKVITMAPYAVDGDPARWDDLKEDYADYLLQEYARGVVGYRPGDEISRHVHSPLDIERINPSFYRSSAQGGEMIPNQTGLRRPAIGWSDYRGPATGLYLTGTSTHPGGPVSGWPGRHTAKAVLDDLHLDFNRIVSGFSQSAPMPIVIVDTTQAVTNSESD